MGLSAQSPALSTLSTLFGPASAWQLRHHGRAEHEVILRDGDEGLGRTREQSSPQALWLLDHWHIARAVRDSVAGEGGTTAAS